MVEVDERSGDVVMSTVVADSTVAALEEQVACYRRLAKLAELQHVHVQQVNGELLDICKAQEC